jgi:uncharacterized membrane protein
MSFLILIAVASLIAYVPQYLFGPRGDRRMAMRHGLALGLLFTGVDHFANGTTRYLPMMPAQFGAASLPLVHLTGAAEVASALGLLVPARIYARLGWPQMQRFIGASLAVLFALLVIANINVAIQGTNVEGLPFGRTYYVVRPFMQPLFMLWALYCVGPWPKRASSSH